MANDMRVVLLFLICFCAFAEADDIDSCAEIKSAVARLDCYDQLAKDPMDEPSTAEKTSPATPVTLKSEPPSKTSPSAPQAQMTEVIQTPPDETRYAEPEVKPSRWSLFGLKPKKDKSDELTHISATLDKVEYMGNGKKVFTLSNGQHWIEREPGTRKIAPGQQVTIIKKRWHYELDPELGPKITVERLDPDTVIVRTQDRREM